MKDCCKEAFETRDDSILLEAESQSKGFLTRLKEKWQTKNIIQVILILCTFTIGGSICGYLGRKLLNFTGLESGVLWVVLYVLLVALLWPACVLLVSIFFGQFKFFRKYVKKIGYRMTGRKAG
jgi:hypothetical protein